MGDLKGHLLPGGLFLVYGLWWAVGCVRRYLLSRQAGTKYTSSATFPAPCVCGRLDKWPLESFAKISLSLFGMVAEIVFNLPHPSMGIVQHATMYFFFMLSGLVDILITAGVPLPPGTDYASLGLAFLVEGLLFANHLHGRDMMDIQIHLLLVYVVFMTVLVVFLEARFQRSIILTLSRCYLLMVQGSWFCSVGVMLYGGNSQAWDHGSHEHVMTAVVYFSWHCAAHIVILIFIAVAMSRCYRPKDGGPKEGSIISMTSLNATSKQVMYRMLTTRNDDDSLSDLENEEPVLKYSTTP